MKNVIETPGRLYYLDWLRVLAMVGIFLFHNARLFNAEDWHVKNATTDMAATIFVGFTSQWIMPLFFLIAGAGTYYSLKSRSSGQYAKERTLRLLVPLIFGLLVIVVPQAYYEAVYQGTDLSGYNIFQIYWLYLQSLLQNLPDSPTFHLWFLRDLFLFSIITIPLFFGRRGNHSVMDRVASVFQKPWALLLFMVISITVVNVLVYPDGFWGYRNGGWNIIAYLLFFLFGYLIFANSRFLDTARKLRWVFLTVGIASAAFILIYVLISGDPKFGAIMYNIGMLVQALCVWGFLLAILGFGQRYLNRNNRFLSYANEAVLPFYILHQTVIITIGYYVVQLDVGVGLKYLTVATASFIGIMLIYEFLVRRINVLRFLFGMKRRRRLGPVAVPADGD